jgi:hypothetical protein
VISSAIAEAHLELEAKVKGVIYGVLLLVGCEKAKSLEPCRICDNPISISAVTCPHCGEPNPTETAFAKHESERKEKIADLKAEQAEYALLIEKTRSQPIRDTYLVMEELERRINSYVKRNGEPPDEDTAKRIAFELKDAWGFGLHFDFIDASTYRTYATGDVGIAKVFTITKPKLNPKR